MPYLILCLALLLTPVMVWAQAVPPATSAPSTNLPSPQAAPTTNLPAPQSAPNPLVVPVASSYLTASQTFIGRGSTATYFDNTGTLQTASANTARQTYDPVTLAAKGVLTEPRRTNYTRNSQFTGITTGTYINQYIGTGNHWRIDNSGALENVVTDVVGTGTVNGMPYLDIHVKGTNNSVSTTFINLRALWSDMVPVSAGQKTIFSGWLGVTSYSAAGGICTVKASNRSYTGSRVFIAEMSSNFTSVTTFAPFQTSVLTHDNNARFADGWFYVSIQSGVTCDVTFRVAAPQFELGSTPTSYIPTNGTTATRAQDIYQQF